MIGSTVLIERFVTAMSVGLLELSSGDIVSQAASYAVSSVRWPDETVALEMKRRIKILYLGSGKPFDRSGSLD